MEIDAHNFLFIKQIIIFSLVIGLVFVYLTTKLRQKIDEISSQLSKNSFSEQEQQLNSKLIELTSKAEIRSKKNQEIQKLYNQAKSKYEKIKKGFHPPVFSSNHNEKLRSAIRVARERQMDLIKKNQATKTARALTWFGSTSDGQKVLSIYRLLLLNAFNAEFKIIRSKLRHNTYEQAVKKIEKSIEIINKLSSPIEIQFTYEYIKLKEKELKIWHKDLLEKEREKQKKKLQNNYIREENKKLANKGINELDEEIEDHLVECEKEIEKARNLAKRISDSEYAENQLRLDKLQAQLVKLKDKKQRSISQAQITKAGYIYVISNKGCFGSNVCKIGMTRRLEPMERIRELGDASVPFKFDVHTLAFVENAPKVESDLHQFFHKKRVNLENCRKEFFRVTPREVHNTMVSMGIESSWYFDQLADEYCQSNLLRKTSLNNLDDN